MGSGGPSLESEFSRETVLRDFICSYLKRAIGKRMIIRKISWKNEEAIGSGPTREFVSIVSECMAHPNMRLFKVCHYDIIF
jgi:hypothetical protein